MGQFITTVQVTTDAATIEDAAASVAELVAYARREYTPSLWSAGPKFTFEVGDTNGAPVEYAAATAALDDTSDVLKS